MMTEDLLQLMTAAVDGELTPVQQWELNQLLVDSVEARSILARLQSDSIRVKNLPLVESPPNLASTIIARLPVLEPVRARRRTYSRQMFALAASLLLAVTLGSLLLFNESKNASPGGGPSLAQNPPNYGEVLPRESSPLSIPVIVPGPPPSNVASNDSQVVPASPSPAEEIPPPRVKGADVLVAPPLVPIPPIDRLFVRVPVLVALADLDRDDARQRLLDELGRDSAYRIDLFAKDAGKASELFQVAAKAVGLNLYTDALAQDRIKKKQGTAYVVYTEALTAGEIRDLFARLAADDANPSQRIFDTLHATAALAADQALLKELLGTDPGLWKRPAAKPETTPPAEPKPISSGTGNQLAKNLTTPKSGEKPAVLLSFTPAAVRTNPALSKELKEFLARRGERKASAVPILIVIRQP
jgi:hypothetical protein